MQNLTELHRRPPEASRLSDSAARGAGVMSRPWAMQPSGHPLRRTLAVHDGGRDGTGTLI